MRRTPQLAIPLAPPAGEPLGISRVERETGLSKDILRAWERRYGFPRPERDAHGERAYTPEQIDKLRLVRRLIERGLRPGKIMSLDLAQLEAMSVSHDASPPSLREVGEFLDALREHDVIVLRNLLAQSLMRKGLSVFVLDTVAPLCEQLSDARVRGDIEEFENRLCLEQMQGVLHSAIQAIQHQGDPPCIVLGSLQADSRSIDRLMLEALLAVGGALCVPLGAGLTARDVAGAAATQRAHIVMMAMPTADQHAGKALCQLRGLLPSGMELWVLGRVPLRLRSQTQGLHAANTLNQIPAMLQQWRVRHGQ